ncbi:MAG: hypothetical protein AAFR20_07345 [Pseudomonadota bacterium]
MRHGIPVPGYAFGMIVGRAALFSGPALAGAVNRLADHGPGCVPMHWPEIASAPWTDTRLETPTTL